MTENLTEAAILTVVGILVVFVALVSLMVAIIVLSRLTSRKETARVEAPPVEVPDMPSGQQGPVTSKETVAAIAVSLARTMAETETVRPRRQEGPMRPEAVSRKWASAGREELMRSRRKVGHRWGKPSR